MYRCKQRLQDQAYNVVAPGYMRQLLDMDEHC